MSSLRDRGMICSVMFRGDSDYCCTHFSADVSGFDEEVGNVCGECRGMCGKVGESKGNVWECVGPGEWVPDLLMMIRNVDLEAVLIGETVGGCADQ